MTDPAPPLERSWFVAALSAAVTARPLSVQLFGQPMVLVRNAGAVWAMADRCPHRGVPLSGGCLTAKGLECPYHGWTFDADGICRDMPGWADAKPPEVRIAACDVLERDGLIWVSAQSRADRGRPLPPRITALDPARQRVLWQTLWPVAVPDVQSIFLQALHAPPDPASFALTDDGFVIDHAGRAARCGWLFRLWCAPWRQAERAWFGRLGVVQLEYRYAGGAAVWITLCCTPRDPHSTHVFATVHAADRWAPRALVRWLLQGFLRRLQIPTAIPEDAARRYLLAAWAAQV